jgi:hypothetical protein
MANEPSNESSLFPSSDGNREDSGLQDILSVTKKIKNKAEDPAPDEDDADASPGDSGLILFSAGDDSPRADEDDGMFGGFSGGLGAGFGAEPLTTMPASSSAADLTPLAGGLAGEGRVKEARPAEAAAKPATESKRSPLVAVAVVLGLSLLGIGAVLLSDKGDPAKEEPVAQAGMSAPEEDAAVGKAEEPIAPDPVGVSAGAVPQPEPLPIAETEGALPEGETEGLGALDPDAGDPMGMRDGLLEADGTNGVAKAGKWDQGTSYAKPAQGGDADADADPEPVEPKPSTTPKKSDGETIKASDGGSDAEVECLLNPDMDKCKGGATTKPKNTEVLAPKVPEKLSTTQLKEGFAGIKSSAKKCGAQHGAAAGTSVKVHVSIEGATGKVTEVRAIGEHAGTPLGSCVEDAVSKAQFEVFKNPSQGADYPLVM